jgi:hypothetical protein
MLRQRTPVLFPGGGDETVWQAYSNVIRLRDGSGYIFSGQHQSGTQRWGFLAKLDTALNVVWTYRHPPQATAYLGARQVYESSTGTLDWLVVDDAASGQPLTNRFYFVRVSATGQLLGQRTFTSAACTQLWLNSWQPLANGGALVTGGYAACGTPGSLVTYTARLDSATVLAERPGQANGGGVQLYPTPASVSATWQGAVPVGTRLAELVLLDVLGRVVQRVAVAGRGTAVQQMLALSTLPAGSYMCRLLIAGQPSGGTCRLVVIP